MAVNHQNHEYNTSPMKARRNVDIREGSPVIRVSPSP